MTDRELDALIAERFMGFKWQNISLPSSPLNHRSVLLSPERQISYAQYFLSHDRALKKVIGSDVPYYCADRNAAALVLIRLHELGLANRWESRIQELVALSPGNRMGDWEFAVASCRVWMEAALRCIPATAPAAAHPTMPEQALRPAEGAAEDTTNLQGRKP